MGLKVFTHRALHTTTNHFITICLSVLLLFLFQFHFHGWIEEQSHLDSKPYHSTIYSSRIYFSFNINDVHVHLSVELIIKSLNDVRCLCVRVPHRMFFYIRLFIAPEKQKFLRMQCTLHTWMRIASCELRIVNCAILLDGAMRPQRQMNIKQFLRLLLS